MNFVDLFKEFEQVGTVAAHPTSEGEQEKAASELSPEGAAGGEAAIESRNIRDLEIKFQDRMTKLENLVVNTMSDLKLKISSEKQRDRADSYSETSDEEMFVKPRSSKRRERRKEPKFSQQNVTLEGESVSTFQGVILVGVRLARQLSVEGEDVTPVLQHLEFMSKKSLMGTYRHTAFVEYDRAVRGRAELEGLEAFSSIATEEVATSFCVENLVPVNNRSSTGKSQNQPKKRSVKYCRAFNESTCSFKNCLFSHVCMACDEATHGKQDCNRVRGKAQTSK